MLKRFVNWVTEEPKAPPVKANPLVDLYFWSPKTGPMNFGDHLSSAIVTKVAADRGFMLDEQASASRRLLALGSILHFAQDGDTVWGSGVNGKVREELHQFRDLDVRAVRGPLTREFLTKRGITVPEVYGDPAILFARLFESRFAHVERGTKPVAYVPNLHDEPLMAGWENVISPRRPWAHVVAEILQAQHVIASSLHGLVIADAFGIPATYLRVSETENIFKYEDYALGAGRGGMPVTTSREQAVAASPDVAPAANVDPLLAAFPFDLWSVPNQTL